MLYMLGYAAVLLCGVVVVLRCAMVCLRCGVYYLRMWMADGGWADD